MKQKLSKLTEKLFKEFDEAAQAWGWQSDQGSRTSAENANTNYTDALVAMIKRLECLEREVAKGRALKKKLAEEAKNQPFRVGGEVWS